LDVLIQYTMKKGLQLVLLMAAVVLMSSCQKDEPGTITGRWIMEGFENAVRVEYQDGIEYTIYANGDGVFPSLADWVAANPGVMQHNYVVEGDSLIVDLNFGNYARSEMVFKCSNDVVHLNRTSVSGPFTEKLYREGHDISACN